MSVLVLLNEEDIGGVVLTWTIKVEVAFATDPMAVTPTWTDITQYVRWDSIEITRGRGDELSDVQPSTMSMALKNGDGRFTMDLATGAYYPNVKIGKRVRVSVTRSAVTYIRFDGHVNDWPTEWVAGTTRYAEAQVSATDRSKRFGRVGELRSTLEEEVLRDTGTGGAYYPLSEPAESASVASIATTPRGTGIITVSGDVSAATHPDGTIQFGDGTGPGSDGLSAPVFYRVDRDNGSYLAADPLGVGTSTAVSLECWFATVSDDNPICALTRPGEGVTLFIQATTGKVVAYYETSTALLYAGVTTGAYNNARQHHLVVTLSRSGTTVTVNLYVDGVNSGSGSGTFTLKALPVFTRMDIGGSHVQHTVGVYRGTLSHVAAYSSVLSAATVTRHYNAGKNGLTGERTDQRIGRIADWIGIPTADRAFDVGDGTVGPQATSGVQPIEAMREVERTENGVLFHSGGGLLTFHKRSRRYNSTPAVTFLANQLAGWPMFPANDFGLVNDYTVSRPAGSPSRSINQASIDAYGLYRDEKDVISDNDIDTRAASDWAVNTYGTPRTRVPNITVEVGKLERVGSGLVAATLAADISTRIKVQALTTQAPASSVELFVEGLTERIGQRQWWIEFNTSPADTSQVWQLGTAGFTELGVTTRLGF